MGISLSLLVVPVVSTKDTAAHPGKSGFPTLQNQMRRHGRSSLKVRAWLAFVPRNWRTEAGLQDQGEADNSIYDC